MPSASSVSGWGAWFAEPSTEWKSPVQFADWTGADRTGADRAFLVSVSVNLRFRWSRLDWSRQGAPLEAKVEGAPLKAEVEVHLPLDEGRVQEAGGGLEAAVDALDVVDPVVLRVYSHDGPIRCRKHGYNLTTNQSDAGSTGIFSRRTNQIQEARAYGHHLGSKG
eukprot:6185027-Pyramimonas_sp.AAC.1